VRVQIFSDLHCDVHPIKPIAVVPGVDLVIVAGDVCEGMLHAFEALRRIVPMDIPIVMVPGNHEFYRRFVPEELAFGLAQAPSYNLHLLSDTTVELGGVRFVGATLWTDYKIFSEANQASVMNACANGMNDHRLIGWQKKPWLRFRPQEAAMLHQQSRAYLRDVLSKPFSGPSVMITHTAVHMNSVLPRYAADLITGAFVSDLEDLIRKTSPALAVHGHVHNSSDYHIGQCRVVCNPHGYGNENAAFNGALVVEIGA
jgi:Icc-related predicted phosphoesterase